MCPGGAKIKPPFEMGVSDFNSSNYKNEFYTVNPQNDLLDVLADKIADKIIKRMKEKGS